MAFEVNDISKILPTKNYLLIRANKEERFLRVGENLKIEIDTTYEPEKHSATYGEVIRPCEELDDHLETELDVFAGDMIYFHYLCIMNCIRDKKYIVCKGVPYFLVSYGSMFCAKTDKDVRCLNGYLLVEPVDASAPVKNEWGFYAPDTMLQKNDKNIGVVKYVGKPLAGQKNLAAPGDKIFFTKAANVPLQYQLHNTFEGNNTFYRMKHSNILAILN